MSSSSVHAFASDKVAQFQSYMGYNNNDYAPIPLRNTSNSGSINGWRSSNSNAHNNHGGDDDLDPDLDDTLLSDFAVEDGEPASCVEALALTRKERFIGFLLCFAIGWLLSFSAASALDDVFTDPARFAVLYTAGNLVSLCSTLFLHGAAAQVRDMFAPARATCTLVYLLAITATLVSAFALRSAVAVLLCMLVQCAAMLWYSLSFIPFGRALAMRLLRVLCPCFCGGGGPGDGDGDGGGYITGTGESLALAAEVAAATRGGNGNGNGNGAGGAEGSSEQSSGGGSRGQGYLQSF